MGRAGRFRCKASEFGVAHDADDAEGVRVLRQIEPEVLIERIFVAFEEAFHEGFVDDGDILGGFIVGGGKSSGRA